jgi:endo-1,4-beta-xylanase
MRRSVFQRLIPIDYIRRSFVWAREADANALLVLNETHLEKRSPMFAERRAFFLQLVERLVSSGAPIQAIGLQGHFAPGLDELDGEELGLFCERLKAMGLSVIISELDASCRFSRKRVGFREEEYSRVFKNFVEVVRSAGNLIGVTVWGLSEKYADPERNTPHDQLCRRFVNPYDVDGSLRSGMDSFFDALRAMGALK